MIVCEFPVRIAARALAIGLAIASTSTEAQEKLAFAEGRFVRTSEINPINQTLNIDGFGSVNTGSTFPIKGTAEVNVTGNPGELVGRISISNLEVLGEDESANGNLNIGLRTARFVPDPAEAGIAALVTVNYTLADRSSGGGVSSLSIEGSNLRTDRAPKSSTLQNAQAISIGFGDSDGYLLQLIANVAAAGSGNVAGVVADVEFQMQILEIRNHWLATTSGNLTDATKWLEKETPSPAQYACFNNVAPLSASLNLGSANASMRGLIVDGSNLNLDLNGGTFELGSFGPSIKTFNILIGEGRKRGSSLSLSNGTVSLTEGLVIGGEANFSGELSLAADASITRGDLLAPSIAIVGHEGDGTLTLSGASRFAVGALTIGNKANVDGDVFANNGGIIESDTVTVGQLGSGVLEVSGVGSRLSVGSLVIGAEKDSEGSVTIGPNSQLSFGEGVSQIGPRGEASLEVLAGSTVEGVGTILEIGSEDQSSDAIFRISGSDTQVTGLGISVRTSGQFHLRDGATWNAELDEDQIEIQGGEALLENGAVARLKQAFILDGEMTVRGSSTLEVSSVLSIGEDGEITVSGQGSKLSGFDVLPLNGHLRVRDDAEIFGVEAEDNNGVRGTIGIGPNGQLSGNRGVIHANVEVANGGRIEPGDSPGLLTIDGDLILEDGSTIRIEISGTEAEITFDRLVVTGDIVFEGGQIELAFINGFAASTSQSFSFLDSQGSITGEPQIVVSGVQEGWEFQTQNNSENGSLGVTSLSDAIPIKYAPSITNLRLVPSTPGKVEWKGDIQTRWPSQTVRVLRSATLLGGSFWDTVTTIVTDDAGTGIFKIEAAETDYPLFLKAIGE